MRRGYTAAGGEPYGGAGTITKIYRAMKPDDNGMPTLGSTATKLGPRRGYDCPEQEDGLLHPETDGLSVSPDSPRRLPDSLRPKSINNGGGNKPAWELDTGQLAPDLSFRRDPDNPLNHGFIEPAYPMTFEEYEAAIHATAASWRLIP